MVLGMGGVCLYFPVPFLLPLTWKGCWGYLYEHLKFSASLLALFDVSEKVHFTPDPSCIALSLDLALDNNFIMQWKRYLIEAMNYESWTGGAVFSIGRLSRL